VLGACLVNAVAQSPWLGVQGLAQLPDGLVHAYVSTTIRLASILSVTWVNAAK
jgi:hypothetical protein